MNSKRIISLQDAKSSIETFSYLTANLKFENTAYFREQLKEFIQYTETDSFFKLTHKGLLSSGQQSFSNWLESQISNKKRGLYVSFPPNSKERALIVYLLLKKINDGEISLRFFYALFEGSDSSLSNFEINTLLDFYSDLKNEMLARTRLMREKERNERAVSIPTADFALKTINISQHIYSGIGQISTGDANSLNASMQTDNSQLLALFSALEKSIKSLGISSEEKEGYLETVDVCRNFLTAEKPKIKQAETLLRHLPAMGNVASIASAIIAFATALPK